MKSEMYLKTFFYICHSFTVNSIFLFNNKFTGYTTPLHLIIFGTVFSFRLKYFEKGNRK